MSVRSQVKDEAENSLLHIACQNNHRRIAKLLLKFRADINQQNGKGNTPLHYCYAYGSARERRSSLGEERHPSRTFCEVAPNSKSPSCRQASSPSTGL